MEGPIKILMTADTLSGVWSYTLTLCQSLQKYNVQVHLLTMGALLTKEQQSQIAAFDHVKLYETNCKIEWMDEPWSDLAVAKEWIADLALQVNPDIIHFNNFGQADTVWNCPVVTVFHSCCHAWWQLVKGQNEPPDWDRYYQLVENAIRNTDILVTTSEAVLNQATSKYGPVDKAEIIYNGSNIIGASVKENFILSSGHVREELTDMNIWHGVAPNLNWPVVIGGRVNDLDSISITQTDNLTYLGELSAAGLHDQMARASIFVVPSKYSPFGFSILEAASAGCALILSDLPELTEIWGDAAFYFDPLDPDSLASVLHRHITNPSLVETMAHRAQKRATKFNTEKMGTDYMRIYTQLAISAKKTSVSF